MRWYKLYRRLKLRKRKIKPRKRKQRGGLFGFEYLMNELAGRNRRSNGRGLLGRDKWSRPPSYLINRKQKGGFLGLAVPIILSALAGGNIRI